MSRRLSLRRDSVQLLPAITAQGGDIKEDSHDATLSGYLRDVSDRDISLGFESGIPPPAEYELLSPAGAPVEAMANRRMSRSQCRLPQSPSENVLELDTSYRRTSLQRQNAASAAAALACSTNATETIPEVMSELDLLPDVKAPLQHAPRRQPSLQIPSMTSRDRRASLQLVIAGAIQSRSTSRQSVSSRRSRMSNSHYEEVKPWTPTTGAAQTQYEGPDLPSRDLPEDYIGEAPKPAPLDHQRHISSSIAGYECTDCGAPENTMTLKELEDAKLMFPEPEIFEKCENIERDECIDAFNKHITSHCCYGRHPLVAVNQISVKKTHVYKYTLDTFSESRRTLWEQEPFRGQSIDGVQNGSAPGPWEVLCTPEKIYEEEICDIEVPHTDHIIACHGCDAMGFIRCHSCLGRGFLCCLRCQGTGRDWKTDVHGHGHVESCWQCHGTGRKRCLQCDGDGRVVCRTCTGYKQLKCCIRIIIMYSSKHSEQLCSGVDVPDELAKDADVQGQLVFEQNRQRVWPIKSHADEQVREISANCLEDHFDGIGRSRIVRQRHRLYAIPVTECRYQWKQQTHRFFVYGKRRLTYSPDYPEKYCCGCVVC